VRPRSTSTWQQQPITNTEADVTDKDAGNSSLQSQKDRRRQQLITVTERQTQAAAHYSHRKTDTGNSSLQSQTTDLIWEWGSALITVISEVAEWIGLRYDDMDIGEYVMGLGKAR
jgi:hypothetical protein